MSFTRSNSGLSNIHLFYGADLVLFTEGGSEAISKEQALSGECAKSSIDIKFWNGILKSHGYDKNIHYRALGSKTTAEDICKKIELGEIKNVAVARDRDLDFFQGKSIDSPFVLYTKGYSWESEIYQERNIVSVINAISMNPTLSPEINDFIESSFNVFRRLSRRLLRIELIFRHQSSKFLTGMKGERFLNGKKLPLINIAEVKKYIEERVLEINRPAFLEYDIGKPCPILNCYGKLLAAFGYCVICHASTRQHHKALPKSLIEMMLIEKHMQSSLVSNDPYYEELTKRLSLAS